MLTVTVFQTERITSQSASNLHFDKAGAVIDQNNGIARYQRGYLELSRNIVRRTSHVSS